MLKLRTILLSNTLYYMMLIVVLIITSLRLFNPPTSKYTTDTTTIIGKIVAINQNNEHLELIVKAKEKVLVTYYLKADEKFTYNLGDKIEIVGTMARPNKNTTENLFNYQKYLEHKYIFYIIEATNLKRISNNKNIYYYLKQKIINRVKVNPYLSTFIIGDKSNISSLAIKSYQTNGVSHLFAISGMHITLLSSILLNILKKLKVSESKRYLTVSIFLLFYLLMTGLSASILRGVLFFILFSLNKVYYFHIKATNIFIFTISISLLINANYLYDIGFWYSYLISLALIIMAPYLNSRNYLISLLKTSIIAFLASMPISLYNFYEINFLSIIYNLIFVPYVSFIVFPLSLITFIFPVILPLFSLSTLILEKLSLLLSNIKIFTISFPRLNIFIYIFYIIPIIIAFIGISRQKKKYLYPLILLLIIHYLYPYFTKETYLKMIDVGQGDSILLHSNNETILIDTGGIISYDSGEDKPSIIINTTIPLLKSLGIRKIDYLIITHGDFDHMGDAKNLLENFTVKNIILNLGETNYLEDEIIKDYSVIIGEEGYTISCGDIELIQLNEAFTDENSSSQIYYGTYQDISMLFMGDASIESENVLLSKYDLTDITILKVGHHGSNTSSSKNFIETIRPQISLISAGVDNKFNHPHKSVLETLMNNNSLIYQTNIHGTITIDFKHSQITTTT